MATCTYYLKIAYTVIGHKEALVTRLRCKRWSCEACSEKNARAWQYWLIKRIPEVSDEWWLVTLTAHEDERTHVGSLKNIRERVDKLIKRVKRVFGENIEYVRVYEKHPSSEACHVHFIMCGLSPYVIHGYSAKLRPMSIATLSRKGHAGTWSVKTWFKKTCGDIGMGYIADVRRFEGPIERAAFYVTKYLTKDMQAIHVAYLRHVQVTKGIGSPQFEKNYEWTPASYITARTFDEPNTRITDIDNGRVIDNNYWEHTGYYPSE